MKRTGKHVLMLVENNPYPQDIRVRAEALTLTRSRYEVVVISPRVRGQAWHETVQGVSVYRFPPTIDGHGLLSYAWEFAYSTAAMFLVTLFVLFREGFDVVHAANPPETLVFIGVFYRLLGKRFIFDHHDLSPEMYCAGFGGKRDGLASRILVWLERLSCRMANHIITTNESYKRIEMERAGVPEERITVVRNGPQLSSFPDCEPDPALRQPGKTLFGYVGIMGAHDGVDYLLRALKHLIHDLGRDDFFCFIIGIGPMLKALNQLKTELGLDSHVKLTGWVSQSEKWRILSSVDICVDPDPSNPFNDRSTMIKIAEYMALGKPIVAFDLPENRFTAQEAGLFVPGNDELEFAKALEQLMDDPVRRQTMGAFARRRVDTTLAWSHSEAHLLAAYQAVLQGYEPLRVIQQTAEPE